MNVDRALAVVLPIVATAVTAAVAGYSGAVDVHDSETRCGEIIAAIYGQLETGD